MSDPIHPDHYHPAGAGFEAIDVIEAFKLDFRTGNAVKYILRHREKGGLEDLKKARWYLERAISKFEGHHEMYAGGILHADRLKNGEILHYPQKSTMAVARDDGGKLQEFESIIGIPEDRIVWKRRHW